MHILFYYIVYLGSRKKESFCPQQKALQSTHHTLLAHPEKLLDSL